MIREPSAAEHTPMSALKRYLLSLGLASCAALPAAAFAQDADRDGVADEADAFPCDPARAAVSFFPGATSSALLAYEDQWPGVTDLDFNDVVLRAHYRLERDAAGAVVSLHAVLDPDALGGVFSNGLGLQLPAPREGVKVRRRVGDGAWQDLALEADASATVVLSPDLRELFGGAAGRINSVGDAPAVAGLRLQVEVGFASPASLSTGDAPFDLFIFRAGDLSHQVHFPRYAGTAAMNAALFGSQHDGSTATRRFVHRSGVPAALSLHTAQLFPREGVPISDLFPDVVRFAKSGGAEAAGFYASAVVPGAGRAVAAIEHPRAVAPDDCVHVEQVCTGGEAAATFGEWSACSGGSGAWSSGAWGACSASTVCSGAGTRTRVNTCEPLAGSGTQTRDASCDWTPGSGTLMPSGLGCTPTEAPSCGPLVTSAQCTPAGPEACGDAPLAVEGCASPAGSESCAVPSGVGTRTCAAGSTAWSACAITACDAGRASCDGADANGCEVNLLSNNSHCGACNSACGAGTSCYSGRCSTTCGSAATYTSPIAGCANLSPLASSYSASSTWGANVAANAGDANSCTGWNAGGYAPALWRVDLGSVRPISAFTMVPGMSPTTASVSHVIEGSNDGTSWATIRNISQSMTSGVLYTFTLSTPVSYRHVRVRTTSTPSWVSWVDVNIWGDCP
jgi:LruC domain-containing protein